MKFQQQPPIAASSRQLPVNVMLDTSPLSDVVLPPTLQPSLTPVNGSRSVAQFYILNDKKTGVLALGSFSDTDFNTFLNGMLQGLLSLKSQGATQLIVDVVSCLPSTGGISAHPNIITNKSNNGGGFICAAHVSVL